MTRLEGIVASSLAASDYTVATISGGIKKIYNGYEYYVFKQSDTLQIADYDFDGSIVIVGGGGAGGYFSGDGGNGGEVKYIKKAVIPQGSYAITIGAGGATANPVARTSGESGEGSFTTISDSQGTTIFSAIGGRGGYYDYYIRSYRNQCGGYGAASLSPSATADLGLIGNTGVGTLIYGGSGQEVNGFGVSLDAGVESGSSLYFGGGGAPGMNGDYLYGGGYGTGFMTFGGIGGGGKGGAYFPDYWISADPGSPNTGGGGGGISSRYQAVSWGRHPFQGFYFPDPTTQSDILAGNGGSGIVILKQKINKYPVAPSSGTTPIVSGGILSQDSKYYYRLFKSSDNLVVSNGTLRSDILLVAGGGAGGAGYSAWCGGGGGAGGVKITRSYLVPEGRYPITIGAGGYISNGSNTEFSTLIYATGGGKGGTNEVSGNWSGGGYPVDSSNPNGNDGGSGGGAGETRSAWKANPGLGILGEGNDGGVYPGSYNQSVSSTAGGGGGAGTPGFYYTSAQSMRGGFGTAEFSNWKAVKSLGTQGRLGEGGGSGNAYGSMYYYVTPYGGGVRTLMQKAEGNGKANTGGGAGAISVQNPSQKFTHSNQGGSGVAILRYNKENVINAPLFFIKKWNGESYTSLDGISWTQVDTLVPNAPYNNFWLKFVGVVNNSISTNYIGANQPGYLKTKNSVVFDYTPHESMHIGQQGQVQYANNKWFVYTGWTTWWSNNGDDINWHDWGYFNTTVPSRLTYVNGKYFGQQYNNELLQSEDGISWSSSIMSGTGLVLFITFHNNEYVVFNQETNVAWKSTDLANWTMHPAVGLDTPSEYVNVYRAKNGVGILTKRYAFGSSTIVYYSHDFINWAPANANESGPGASLSQGTQWIAESGGKIMLITRQTPHTSYMSDDGINWTQGGVVAGSIRSGSEDTTFLSVLGEQVAPGTGYNRS